MSDYPQPPASSKPSVWQVALVGLAFVLVYLLWAAGFDWVCRQMSGGVIESIINWLCRVWFWGVLILLGLGVAFSALVKR
jgi:hypothetical protein